MVVHYEVSSSYILYLPVLYIYLPLPNSEIINFQLINVVVLLSMAVLYSET